MDFGGRQRARRGEPTGKEEEGVFDCVGIWLPNRESVDLAADRMKKGGIEYLYPLEELKDWEEYYTVSYCDPDNYVIEIFAMPMRQSSGIDP